MTREAFIRKWLANKNFQYCEEGRAEMRNDLDMVIEYHTKQLHKYDLLMTEQQFKERCAEILRDNITFSHQVGDYVIHGALESLWKLHTEQNRYGNTLPPPSKQGD